MVNERNSYDNPLMKGKLGDLPRYITQTDMDKVCRVIIEGFEDNNTYVIQIIDTGLDGMIYDLKSIKGYNNGWQSINTLSNPANFRISDEAVNKTLEEIRNKNSTLTQKYLKTFI